MNDLYNPLSTLFLSQQFIEVIIFCILLYVYKIKKVKHIVIVMLLVALLGTNKWTLPDGGQRIQIKPFLVVRLLCCLATNNEPMFSYDSCKMRSRKQRNSNSRN